MTDQHPIAPPPELVNELQDLGNLDAITLAYRAGADQELEACCQFVRQKGAPTWSMLRAARRPKPPSLKTRALQAWAAVEAGTDDQAAMAVIRRALEQLDD